MKCVRPAAHLHRLLDAAGSFKSRAFHKRTARGNIRGSPTPIYKCVKLFGSSPKKLFFSIKSPPYAACDCEGSLPARGCIDSHAQNAVQAADATHFSGLHSSSSFSCFFLLHNCVTHKLAFATFLEEKPGMRKKRELGGAEGEQITGVIKN